MSEIDYEISEAEPRDASAILEVQRLAFTEEMKIYGVFDIPPITETVEELVHEFAHTRVLKATAGGDIVGAVRARREHGSCLVGRLVVHPDLWNKGIGATLMRRIEEECSGTCRMELFTGSLSVKNIKLYEKLGYRTYKTRETPSGINLVFMEKALDCGAPRAGEAVSEP